MRRTLLAFVLFAAVLYPGITLAQAWSWGKTADVSIPYSTPTSAAHAWPMATDASGNVYMALWSSFDTIGYSSARLHNANYQSQVILLKYDNSGHLLWLRSSTAGDTKPIDIAVDPNGSVFLYGYFNGDAVSFGSQTIARTAPIESKTTYIIKYDKDGAYQWKVNAGTISIATEKEAYGSIAADADGNAYAMATFYNNVKIGATTLTNAGCEDISVAKYSPAGAVMWAKHFGGTGYDKASSITVNKDGKILMAGEFSSPSIVFGSSALTFSASCPSMSYACLNIYLAELNAMDGSVNWAKQTQGNTRVMSVVTDSLNDIYIGGAIIDDEVSFSGTSIMGHANDPFLAKYNSIGLVMRITPFTQTMTVDRSHAIWDLTIDACNNIWVAGGMDTMFGNGVYIDTTIILPVPQMCTDPLYIISYTPEGHLSDYAILSSGGLNNSGLAADKAGNVFLCGYYNAAATMFIGADSVAKMTNVAKNYFIGKYLPYNSCLPNNVTSVANETTLNIFPNPATNALNISAGTTIGKVTISDMLGKTVFSDRFAGTTATVNIATLAPGVYIMRTTDGQVRKFVKN